jgi:phosphoribosylamine--glycine ligase
MRVLVVGSGGREHALAWKLRGSPALAELHAAPGNTGMRAVAECHDVAAADGEGIVRLAQSLAADLVVVGPEAPLVAGLADRLADRGLACFGPTAAAAQIEGSKAFAKGVLRAAGVATAAHTVCDTVAAASAAIAEADGAVVVKADGLAAGKGVFVCSTAAEAEEAARACLAEGRFGESGARVLIEERLSGPEVSLLALCDGRRAVPLAPARDYKRALDGDRGPNTGGMGCVAPPPGLEDGFAEGAVEAIHQPVVDELARRGMPFRGCLYAGLMLTASGPRVIEFNARFGDPETQAILPLLEGDLLDALDRAARGDLDGVELRPGGGACVTVVLAGRGYPETSDHGTPISGIGDADAMDGVTVFHAATAGEPDAPVTAGGRVLNVSAVGGDVADARERAYRAAERIRFDGKQMRRDIAAGAVPAGAGG